MKRKIIILLFLAAVFALHTPDAAAQYNVPHGVFSNGGGVRSGSHFSYDTAGQSGVGISSGGSYIVKSGFWYIADISSTVDVAITSFEGEYAEDTVILRWSVRSDSPFDGFNVYRTDGESEDFIRVNTGLVPANDSNEYKDGTAIPGRSYDYRIGAVDGGGETFSITISITLPPKPLTLYQNFPNPFNPSTSIAFFLPEAQHVTLTIYDVRGRLVKTLVDAGKEAGKYTVGWNGTNGLGASVGSGVYYYRLTAGKKTITRKLVVLR